MRDDIEVLGLAALVIVWALVMVMVIFLTTG